MESVLGLELSIICRTFNHVLRYIDDEHRASLTDRLMFLNLPVICQSIMPCAANRLGCPNLAICVFDEKLDSQEFGLP